MKQLNLEQVHSILLGILKDIDAFCTSNGITYSLAGGTLLGAVRHGGFIPWDDDADIVMPRKDFDRFCAEYGNERYSIVPTLPTEGTTDVFVGTHKKVQDKMTLSNEGIMKGIYHYGISVDIFPMDGLPDDEKERNALLKRGSHFRRRVNLHNRPLFALSRHQGAFLAKLEAKMHSAKYWLEKSEALMHSFPYEGSKYVGCICGVYGVREAFPAEIFKEYTRLKFEDCYFSCTKEWDRYLTGMYGDYMTPPPAKQRAPKHELETFLKYEL